MVQSFNTILYPGINHAKLDIFVAVVTSATDLGNLLPGAHRAYNIARIQDVAFFCVNNSTYDLIEFEGNPLNGDVDGNYMPRDPRPAANAGLEHPCASLKKLISTGTFYFAPYPQWDLSSRVSESLRHKKDGDRVAFNGQMLWNEYLVSSLLDFRDQLEEGEQTEFDRYQFIVTHHLVMLCVSLP